jgi:hypothetical protein
MANEPDAQDDREIHPMYEVAAHIEELFSIPAYRSPKHELIESWRELGERLLALGERHLEDGIAAGTRFLEEKLEARRKRRERRAARSRARKRAS